MNALRLAFSYIRHRPLAAALNVTLLGLGTAAIALLLMASAQFDERLRKDADVVDMVVGSKGSPMQLVLSTVFHADVPVGNVRLADVRFLSEHQMVERLIPLALGDGFRGYRIVGTTHAYVAKYGGELAEGQLWEAPLDAVLGAAVARKVGLGLGAQFVGEHGVGGGGHVHETHPYDVVGILAPTGSVLDRLVLTSVETVRIVHEPVEDDDHEGHAHDDDGHEGHAHEDEGHEDDSHEGHAHEDEGHGDDGHEGHAHEDEGHGDDGHEGHAHEDEGHGDDGHEGHAHEDEGHGDDGHDGHAHEDEGHDGHAHEDEGHEDEGHDGHAHEDEGHDDDGHDGHAHEDEGHDDDGHDGHAHEDEGHDDDGHDGHAHEDEGHGDDSHDGHAHEDEGHEGDGHGEGESPLAGEDSDEVTAILVDFSTPIAASSLPREINKTTVVQAARPALEIGRLLRLAGFGAEVVGAFALILVLAAVGGVFAALFSALEERRSDLAMMRVLGATRLRLFWQILLEGLILSVTGIVAGLALAHAAAWIAARWLWETTQVVISAGWVSGEAGLVAGVLALGVAAALPSAVRAFRLDIPRVLSGG